MYVFMNMSVVHTYIYTYVQYINKCSCSRGKHPLLYAYEYINICRIYVYTYECLLYMHIFIRTCNVCKKSFRNRRKNPPLRTY